MNKEHGIFYMEPSTILISPCFRAS